MGKAETGKVKFVKDGTLICYCNMIMSPLSCNMIMSSSV